jgi:para-aminobenzoate synthetase component 1
MLAIKILSTKKIPWQDPLQMARAVSLDVDYKENWVFLYSGLHETAKESKSYLALYPNKEISSNNFDDLEFAMRGANEKWFGYFSYDLKNLLEELPVDKECNIELPDLWFADFNLVLEFDHKKKTISCSCQDREFLNKIPKVIEVDPIGDIKVGDIESNFTKAQYLSKVEDIKDRIIEGELYQANLTRKFSGPIEVDNKFDIFLKLNKSSPANYSSFMKIEDSFIISSSPELFLQIKKDGSIQSSPIKGTSPRFQESEKDTQSKDFLRNCKKEQSENLMIVDLVRNDLSRTCKTSSVEVKNLFKIDSYETLHHMSSDVIGTKEKKFSNLDVMKHCFPPASMTGAPKIRAMQVCSNLEIVKRGVYSGAIGFISKNECKLSVVIRTLIIQDGTFEFQVGGAITHGSEPIKEWEETISKAKGVSKAIGLDLERVESL